MTTVRTIEWADDHVRLIDQSKLPLEGSIVECRTADEVAEAIRTMKLRGAPAIGVAAGFGLGLWAQEAVAEDASEFLEGLDEVAEMLAETRPTAINLFWAIDRIKSLAHNNKDASVDELRALVVEEAQEIAAEDLQRNQAIGEHGMELLEYGTKVLTHCNAGSLATSGFGTALSPIFAAHRSGRLIHVLATETRPLLQGARLTSWELLRAGIEVVLITDSMVGRVMQQGGADIVLVGADRIAANGDVANKIGTYTIAALAARHGVPFYVCAPTSTIDLATPDGDAIPIEERDPDEVLYIAGKRIAPEGVSVYNPAFDVTPAELIAGIVTENGIARPPFSESLAKLCAKSAKPKAAKKPAAKKPASAKKAAAKKPASAKKPAAKTTKPPKPSK